MSITECKAIHQGLVGGDPLAFLSENIIITGTGSQTDFPTSAARLLDFENMGSTGNGGSYYSLTTDDMARIINGYLPTYYLPWGRDTGYYVILDPDDGPDIMMTASMTGCSVGYVRSGDGAVRVSHHNVFSPRTSEMDKAQKTTLQFAKNTFHPSEYFREDFESTDKVVFKGDGMGFVFGVRHKRHWTMYAQTVYQQKKTDAWTAKVILSDISVKDVRVF